MLGNNLPKGHKVLWWGIRAGLMLWGIYGIFHGSVVEFLEAIFAIMFTHLWDFFQIFGGRSFITKVDYRTQTMLNVFIFVGVVVGSTLNNRTDFKHFDIVTHFCAGFLSAWFGYELAVLIQGKRYGKLSPALAALFALCFSLGIAVGWEFYEFTMDRVYGLALQCSSPTTDYGLVDTMTDFILAACGAVLGMFFVSFVKNGIVGKNKKEIRARLQEEKDREKLKQRLLEDYMHAQNHNINGKSGGY